jgi:hypothetical protein
MPAYVHNLSGVCRFAGRFGMFPPPFVHMLDRAEKVDERSGKADLPSLPSAPVQAYRHIGRFDAAQLPGLDFDVYRCATVVAARADLCMFSQPGRYDQRVHGAPSVQLTTSDAQPVIHAHQ